MFSTASSTSAWPAGLNLAQNLADLVRHEREFDAGQAFAWIIRSAAGIYLGCAYLKPDLEARGAGRVYTWIRKRTDRLELLAEFNAAFRGWLAPRLPDDFSLTWRTNDQPDPGPPEAD